MAEKFHRDYWKDNEEYTIEFLDNIDDEVLYLLIDEDDTVRDIMLKLEAAYNDLFVEQYPSQSELFDALGEDELQDYLCYRFDNLKFIDVWTSKVWQK